MGEEKLKVLIFDGDQKVRKVERYPVSASGSKIAIKNAGGAGHFMPDFTKDTFLEIPVGFWKFKHYERWYFVRKGASACVDFATGEVPEYDEENILKSAGNILIESIGKEPKKETPLLSYLMAFLLIIIVLQNLGVLM